MSDAFLLLNITPVAKANCVTFGYRNFNIVSSYWRFQYYWIATLISVGVYLSIFPCITLCFTLSILSIIPGICCHTKLMSVNQFSSVILNYSAGQIKFSHFAYQVPELPVCHFISRIFIKRWYSIKIDCLVVDFDVADKTLRSWSQVLIERYL